VEHATKGSHDLVEIEGEAIAYWHRKLSIPVIWAPIIREAQPIFTNKVILFFTPEHQVHMKATTFQFVSRGPDGKLVLADPEGFEFEVREIGASATT
jgi:hypothetical protein